VVALEGAALLIVLLLPRGAGGWPTTMVGASAFVALIVAYLALMERAAMYDSLWSSIIVPQFLIATSSNSMPRTSRPTATSGATADVFAQQHEPLRLDSAANGASPPAMVAPPSDPSLHRAPPRPGEESAEE
jgi:hypothetical protein